MYLIQEYRTFLWLNIIPFPHTKNKRKEKKKIYDACVKRITWQTECNNLLQNWIIFYSIIYLL